MGRQHNPTSPPTEDSSTHCRSEIMRVRISTRGVHLSQCIGYKKWFLERETLKGGTQMGGFPHSSFAISSRIFSTRDCLYSAMFPLNFWIPFGVQIHSS